MVAIDRVQELTGQLVAAVAEVERLKAALVAACMDVHVGAPPATAPPPRNAPVSSPSANTNYAKAKKGERHAQILAAARGAPDATPLELAERLGLPLNIVHTTLWRLRQSGDLPKQKRT